MEDLENDELEFEKPAKIERTCLVCSKEFTAVGRFNRVCRHCRQNQKTVSSEEDTPVGRRFVD